MKLTDEQKKAYLKNSGKCPYCKSEDISGGFVQVDGDTAWQELTCNDCDEQWNDVYTLSDVESE